MNIVKLEPQVKFTAEDLARDLIEKSDSGPKGKAKMLLTITEWENGEICMGYSDMRLSDVAYLLKAGDMILTDEMRD